MEIQLSPLNSTSMSARAPSKMAALRKRSVRNGMVVPQEHRPIINAAPVNFHIGPFIEQLFYQVFFPLSIPVIYVIRGANAVSNMRLLPSRDQVYISVFQLLLSGSLVVAIACWLADNMSDARDGGDTMQTAMTYECAMLIIGMFFQRMAVATKYAYMPAEDYRRLVTTRMSFQELQEDQIIYGWTDVSDSLLSREMQLAGLRLGMNPNVVYMRLSRHQLQQLRDSMLDIPIQNTEAPDASPRAEVTSINNPVLVTLPEIPSGRPRASLSSQATSPKAIAVPIQTNDVATNPIFGAFPISEQEDDEQPDGETLLISAVQVAKALFQRTNRSALLMSGKIAWVVLVLCVLVAFIPLLVRVSYGIPALGYNALQTTVFVCFIYCQFWFPLILLSYMRISILDYRRRGNALVRMTKLGGRRAALTRKVRSLSASSLKHLQGGGRSDATPSQALQISTDVTEDVEPTLPLHRADNVIAWLAVRRLLLHVGLRYFKRLEAYTSQALILTVAIAIAVLAILTTSGRSGTSQSSDVAAAAVGLVELVLLAGHILLMLLFGARANLEAEEHAAQLTARQAEARQLCQAYEIAGDADKAMQYRHCCEMIDTAIAAVRNDGLLEPVRILGIKADFSLLNTIAAGAVSAISASAALLKNLFLAK